MIGYFIMKSEEEFKLADPEKLVNGMRQISFRDENQERFEKYLLSFQK